jgi:hypothetical protein
MIVKYINREGIPSAKMLEEILEDTQTSGSSDLHHSSQGETCSFFARAMSKLSRPAKFILGALGALGVFGYSMIAESSNAMAQSTVQQTEKCNAPKDCKPKILAAGNGSSTEGSYSNSVVKVDTCCRDDLSLEIISDAEKLSIILSDENSKARIRYFSHAIKLLYPGKGDKKSDNDVFGTEKNGHQYFERIILLKDKKGNVLDEVKNVEENNNNIHFYVPSTYDLLPVTFYPKFAYTFDLWSMSSDLTMKDLPVRMIPGQGVGFAGTPFMASLKLGNPVVNEIGYAANIIFNTSFEEEMMSIAASLAFELKGDTSREIKFGCGLLGGYNHNQFVSKGLSRLSVGNIALMFYGDELGNGPFKKPFDDIEYQIMFGSLFSGESTGPDAGKYVLYITLGTEWFFDFARVGPVNLLGMHMNASIRPYMDYPLDEESTKLYDFDKKSDLWLIVGPKMRLEIDKWNNLRLDLKPAYFIATDFDRYIQGFLLTLQAEY